MADALNCNSKVLNEITKIHCATETTIDLLRREDNLDLNDRVYEIFCKQGSRASGFYCQHSIA